MSKPDVAAGRCSLDHIVGHFLRIGDRGKFFAWYPVQICKLVTLPNGNGQWQGDGWAWLETVQWVKHCVSKEVTYYKE